jgi:hypothetical protein
MKRVMCLVIAVCIILMGCSTFVSIRTSPDDAKIKVNGQIVGKGQVDAALSNFDFSDYNVEISKPGYQTLNTSLQKEFKVGAFILGLFLWPELLFVYGPNSNQVFELEKDNVGI